jgi:hypothetical protein
MPTPTQEQQQQQQQQQQRTIKWEYIVPIAMTPIAHMCVTLMRQYPQHRTKLIYGIGAATFLTIQTRMIFMYDAGYPAAEANNRDGLPPLLKLFALF